LTVSDSTFRTKTQPAADHPLAALIGNIVPHLTVRRLDEEEDRFISLQISTHGTVTSMSNDRAFAIDTFNRLLLDCPPSFHTIDEFDITEDWISDPVGVAFFLGMLSGARGWDPSHNIPANIRQSLEEAHNSLESANYRSNRRDVAPHFGGRSQIRFSHVCSGANPSIVVGIHSCSTT